ncbi:MAG TPA: mannose-1-phosphate guanylyltransferase/mannose-6-phosphate isomerase [Proteobacteria bacterium]|nr:alginate biosynthesis protein AlgA [bacterium BMS3Abin14]HDL52490.1 mannose-1-phosphate guanylyltransferase/mannose-6-phosphate isomerase [Pseudomonadota bacterium]
MGDLFALILAGGSGTRLWPLSRRYSPKQLLSLADEGGLSLLQDTVRRLESRVASDRMVIVTSHGLRPEIKRQISDYLAPAADNCLIVGEPSGRNTAPAILLGAMLIQRRDSDAVVIVAPADHIIQDPGAFGRALDTAEKAAAAGSIVTFGIPPLRPETGYGYIQAGEKMNGCFVVEKFEEKPTLERAENFLEKGDYLWNSGMFCFTASTIIDEARRYLPEMMTALEMVELESLSGLERAYDELEAISIDHGVMEKTRKAVVVPLSAGWSDVGSWDSLYEIGSRDADGNLIRGDVMAFDTSGSLLVGSGKMLAVTGMKDVIVVDAEDALLICPRGESQDVRKIVGRLDEEGRTEHLMHPTVQKPWGSYRVLEEGSGYLVKRITVDPGQKLSLQMHRHRSEHWVVVAGRALVTVGEETTVQEVNEKTFIPTQTRHRLENAGPESLNIIEVQLGDVISEDDIVRFEDIYGRIHDRR